MTAVVRVLAPAVFVAALVAATPTGTGGATKPSGPKQLAGKAGCISLTGSGGRCSKASGLDGVAAIAVSPDGRHVYVASDARTIAVLARDRATGALRQQMEPTSCLAPGRGCAVELGGPIAGQVVVSRDGRHLYAALRGALLAYARDATSGQLTQLPGEQGCLHRRLAGCGRARALGLVTSVGITRDGRFLVAATYEYLGSSRIDSALVFARDAASGAMTQLSGTAGCVEHRGQDGCAVGEYLYDTDTVAISPDGSRVFSAQDGTGHLSLYVRGEGGALSRTGCYQFTQWAPEPGCKPALTPKLYGGGDQPPTSLAVSPDGRTLYAASYGAIYVFNIASGHFDQLPGKTGCLGGGPTDTCSMYRAAHSGYDRRGAPIVALSPDGKRLYSADDGLVTFARAASGRLTQLAGTAGCIGEVAEPGCQRGRALTRAAAVAVSPDGRHVYVAAPGADAVAAFSAR